jgi:Flp pilus assembly protein TadG
MRTHHKRSHRNQQGAVILWMALFLLVMLAFIGLGIDMAKLMAARVQLQKAADAAALAGASAFQTGNAASAVDTAKARAAETALYNKAFEMGVTPVVLDPNDIIVDLDSLWVTVTTRRDTNAGTPVVTHFLRVIGLPNLGMQATATAKAEGGCTIVPLAVQAPTGQTFQPGCPVPEYIIKNAPPTGTTGGYGPIQVSDECAGNRCSGGGASKFRCEMLYGVPCSCIEIGGCLPSEQGNMSGPTKDAIEQRFEFDTDKREGICFSEYNGNGQRVVIAPLTGPKEGSGGGCYTSYALGRFFIKRIPGNGNLNFITAEFLEYVDPEGLGYDTFAVRLIR